MKSHPHIPKSRDIVLFQTYGQNGQGNVVKNYLNYLKFCRVQGPYQFSHVGRDAELIEGLTIRENLYLDSIPLSLIDSKEFKFRQHLDQTQNRYLSELLHKVVELDVYPSSVDQRTRKIVGLIKTLLKDTEYIFYHSPEAHLEQEDLEIFIKALHFHLGKEKKIAFISSEEEQLWIDFATKTVVRDEQQRFETNPVMRHTVQRKFLSQGHETNEKDESESLIFHMPEDFKKIA